MSLTIVPVGQVFGKYEQQARIAELNKKITAKTIQNQADRVTISSEARKVQVLSIARSVREASKHLATGSQQLEGEDHFLDSDKKSSSLSESLVQKALDKSRDAFKGEQAKMAGVIQKALEKSNE